MNKKQLYWQIEDNGDLSITCSSAQECSNILEIEFERLDDDEKKETQYTITPVWYTQEEYNNLPEA